MKDLTTAVSAAPRPMDNVHPVGANATTQADEALRRSVAADLGPRAPGTVYDNAAGTYRVLTVIHDPSEARRILKRRAAQFAVEILDIFTGERRHTCAVWTGSDRVLKAVTI
jgi:hypothetical protein